VTVTDHENDARAKEQLDPATAGFAAGFKIGFEVMVERNYNQAAHQYFDLYAMLFPYTVSLEGL
jgi:hypothetical protein